MNAHRHLRQDRFTSWLFKLPAELRLQIYDYLVPETNTLLIPESSIWHEELCTADQPGRSNRRSFRWLSVSREVFLDAAPVFYSSKTLYFWIDSRSHERGRTIDSALQHHVKLAHPGESKWAVEIIRSQMLTKLMLEVHAPSSGENLQSVLLRFAEMAPQFRRYRALKQLYISLRPHYNNAHHKSLLRSFKIQRLQEKTIRDSWTMRRMCRAVRQIKSFIPCECNVEWYLPGKTLAKVPYRRRDSVAPGDPCMMESEQMVIEFMESMWIFVRERSDQELDELLSEQELEVAWPPSPHK